ncbi:FxSxx-COOH system tetratricopeptide repeat protein [Streptomyces sp. NPDC047000]|uniref:FxSxx-COOH system tetratricopeptide repeat protein n=1 Tax=Streptomyces sp. NPDC047000 TaxID=3155474 RepID=UPI0033C3DF7E
MSSDPASLPVAPLVAWPRRAVAGRSYLVTVDLDGPVAADDWPYTEEELEFGVALDGAPRFVCEVLNDPSVVLHRFGGTYGPARFVVTAHGTVGPAAIWLTISNRWGVPVRTVELAGEIVDEPDEPGEPAAVVSVPWGGPVVGQDFERVPLRDLFVLRGGSGSPPGEVASSTSDQVTISYAGAQRPWAAWISHQIEQAGCRTSLRRWDPGSGTPLADALADLFRLPGRILFIFDDGYLRLGDHSEVAWSEAMRAVPAALAQRLAAVSLTLRALPAFTANLVSVDLRELDPEEARRRVLRCLGLPLPGGPSAEAGQDAEAGPRFPEDVPHVWNVPVRNTRFTGRDELLDEIHDRFERPDRGVARVALRGMSGVGKSQIAIEYAHRFGTDYDVVWWVSAGFRATARERFAQLAPSLELPVGQELRARIRAVHDALRAGQPYRRWLVVLDGADDVEQIQNLLPEGDGHVLLTTLTGAWEAHDVVELRVPPFRRAESVAYVRDRAPRLTPDDADRLAEAVQDLPLLLAQTAAWLAANDIPVQDYIAMIRRGEAGRIGIRISTDYPLGFRASWSITLDTLRDRHRDASELLDLFAFFSPDAIPVRLMQTARPAHLPPVLAAVAADPVRWRTALRRLSESTAVRLEYSQSAGTAVDNASMHRLYHGFLLSSLSQERREELSRTACTLLAAADPRRPNDTAEWNRYAELIPHLEAAGALDSTVPEVRQLVLNCIEYMRIRGETRAALKLCEQAFDRWHTRLDPEDPDMLVLIHDHANMLRRGGRYLEAEAVGRAVLERLTESRRALDPDLLRARNGLAGTLVSLGRYEEAHQMFHDCVRAYTATHGSEATRTLQDRSNLAVVTGLLGRFEESLEMHLDILLFRERLLHPRHHLTLRTGMLCAWMLRLLGRYAEAVSRQDANHRDHRRVMDRYTPQALLAEHNFALCKWRIGERATAEAVMKDVVDRFVQRQGPRHPDALLVQAGLAMLELRLGRLEDARRLAVTVADGYLALVGPAHPYALGTAGNVGLVLDAMGERGRAAQIAEETLAAMREAVGPVHPWTLGAGLNASGARSTAGRREAAADLSGETLRSASRVMGAMHPLTLSCAAAHADDLRGLRHVDEAGKLERSTLLQLEEALGPHHPQTMETRQRRRPFWDFEPLPT